MFCACDYVIMGKNNDTRIALLFELINRGANVPQTCKIQIRVLCIQFI